MVCRTYLRLFTVTVTYLNLPRISSVPYLKVHTESLLNLFSFPFSSHTNHTPPKPPTHDAVSTTHDAVSTFSTYG